MKKLFLDDLRFPVAIKDFYYLVRSSKDCIVLMNLYGCPNYISFDHDLGGDDTAMNIIKFMIDKDLDTNGNFIPEDFSFDVHSANPVGTANIIGMLAGYLNEKVKE